MYRESPKVSIIVPLFNKGPYVAETIRSAISQTTKDLEIVVVDNGSSDEGPEIVGRLAVTDKRILFVTAPGRGPGHARNYGIKQSSSDWILFLDADDILKPNHLASLLEVHSQNPNANVIAGGWQEFRDGHPNQLTVKKPSGTDPSQCLLDSAIAASPWVVHAAMLKRELLLKTPWPEDMDSMLAEDNAFWFRICLNATVAFSTECGALYRTQTQNCRTQSDEIAKWFSGVHEAVTRNISALHEHALKPNGKQARSLMHLYSELYTKAEKANDQKHKTLALQQANYWLNESSKSGEATTPSMLFRRLLGIPLTQRLKLLLSQTANER